MEDKPIVITITNNKGGVGKTAITTNLGAALALKEKSVCLIDLDTQGNLTQNLLPEFDKDKHEGILHALLDPDRSINLSQVMYESVVSNLYVVPNEVKIGDITVSLSNELEKEFDKGEIIKKLIERDSNLSSIDYILIDTPPTKDLVVANALLASDYYIVPTISDDGSINGLQGCIEFTERSMKKINNKLTLLGVVLSNVNKAHSKTKLVSKELKEGLGDNFFENQIPTSVHFGSLINENKTVFDLPKSKRKGAQEYLGLAGEVISRVEKMNTKSNQEQASL